MVDRTRRRDPIPYEIDFSEVIDPTADQAWRARYSREQAQRIVTQVSDGWLIGFRAGENGGSLWWYPSKPGQGRKLWDQNVLAILDGSDPSNKLILSGLAHLSSDVGVALWVGRDDNGNWGILTRADLRGAPSAHAKHSRGWMVAHSLGIDLILPDRTIEAAPTSSQWLAVPESIAVGPLGEIAVGRQLFVNLFRPVGPGYREEIYIPGACAKFRDDGLMCVCEGAA